MKFDEESLRKKGWNEEEIEHAKSIIQDAHKNKHPTHKYLEQAMYWFLFVIIIGIGIGGAFLIEPLLIVLKPTGAYIIIGIIGLVFGTFAGIIVKDIENLERHHHLAISIIIPITAIISSILISKQVTEAADKLGIIVEIHPIALGIIFSITTLIPYALFTWTKKRKNK